MDFDKDEIKMDKFYNHIKNNLSKLDWLEKEIQLHEAIINKTQGEMFFTIIDLQIRLHAEWDLDMELEKEFKVFNP